MKLKSPKDTLPKNAATQSIPKKTIPEITFIDTLTFVMDDLFRIPGTKIRFGLDPILGIFPWVGDIVGSLASGAIIIATLRYGVSGKVLLMMTGNLLLDLLAGSVPVIGDIFDLTFKTNRRNLTLLRKHLEEGHYEGNGREIIIGVLVGLGLIFGLFLFLIWKLIVFLMNIRIQ